MNFHWGRAAALSCAVWIGASAGASAAFTVGFDNIFPTSNMSESAIDPYAGFFSLTVEEAGAGAVRFLVSNDLPAGSTAGAVGSVHFDDAWGLLDAPSPNDGNVGQVSFGPASGALPQGAKADFDSSRAFRFARGSLNQVDPGEVLGVRFLGDYALVEQAFRTGAMRVGLHVQRITDDAFTGASDALISSPPLFGESAATQTPPAVPLPAPLALLGLGVAALIGAARRRRRA